MPKSGSVFKRGVLSLRTKDAFRERRLETANSSENYCALWPIGRGLHRGKCCSATPKTSRRTFHVRCPRTNRGDIIEKLKGGRGYSPRGGRRAKFLTKQTRICWLIYRDDLTSPRLRSSSAWAIPISLFPDAAPETAAGLFRGSFAGLWCNRRERGQAQLPLTRNRKSRSMTANRNRAAAPRCPH